MPEVGASGIFCRVGGRPARELLPGTALKPAALFTSERANAERRLWTASGQYAALSLSEQHEYPGVGRSRPLALASVFAVCRAAYAAALGDRFVGHVLPDSAANTDVAPFFARHVACPHSVVTAHLIDAAGQPTVAARDEILAFFARRLAPLTA